MSVLIQNGTLLCPGGPVRADLRTAGEKIAEIGPALPAGDSRVIDAAGKLVFPGFIDTHTHFEMNKGLPNETADDWATGTLAALAGGATTVLDFAEPERGASLASALEAWHARAGGRASCHYGFHMTIKDWNPSIRAEPRDMAAAGVTSFKIYLAYDSLRVSDGAACEIVAAVGGQGGVVGCHCENGDLVTAGIRAQKAAGHRSPAAHPRSRPAAVEAEAVNRWLTIAELAGHPVNVVHLSTARGLEAVRAARARGQKVYAETCPQYLLLDESRYLLPGFEGAKYILSPPLRTPEDQAALWEALGNGEIDTVGTDHCSFNFRDTKALGREDFSKIPNGIPGVEHRPALLYTAGVAAGRISAHRLMVLLAEQPARLFGMYPQKGALAVGSDADLVIFDPNYTGSITAAAQHQNVDYTPYEGMETAGRTETVLLSGEVAVEDGAPVLSGRGRFVPPGARRVLAVRAAVGAVLMAAGSARRFGADKLLHPVEGIPLIERAMAALPASLFARAAVCAARPEILSLARSRGYLAFPNPGAAEGQAASIRLGLSAMAGLDGVLFAVCDQPFLTTDSIIKLLDSFSDTPNRICALSWRGARGNPVIFPAALFPELTALTGDTGGGAVLRAHPELLRLVEAASPAELRDVDTPADLRASK